MINNYELIRKAQSLKPSDWAKIDENKATTKETQEKLHSIKLNKIYTEEVLCGLD